MSGRTRPLASTRACQKCEQILRSHQNGKIPPRVQIRVQGGADYRKFGGYTAVVNEILRQDGAWWIGIKTDSPRKNLADETCWTDEDLEVLEGDLDWYGYVKEGLSLVPCQG